MTEMRLVRDDEFRVLRLLAGLVGKQHEGAAVVHWRPALRGIKGNPAIILISGLQGSGKTTHSAKLAKLLKTKRNKKYKAAK